MSIDFLRQIITPISTAEILRLGIAVLPLFGWVWWWIRRLDRGRRVLQLGRGKELDVVMTTSLVAEPEVGVPVVRPLTGFGQVRGLGSCTRAMSRIYPRKKISLHFSEYARGELDRDLVLLGGPVKNKISRRYLRDFRSRYALSEFDFDDANRNIRIDVKGHKPFERRPFIPEMETSSRPGDLAYPETDIGIIVLSRHRGAGGREFRCIMCAGMTTYGTAAAADYLFGQLVRMSRWKAWKLAGVPWFKRRRDMIIVVRGDFTKGELNHVEAVAHFRLRPARGGVRPARELAATASLE